jgi:hypothetical protein
MKIKDLIKEKLYFKSYVFEDDLSQTSLIPSIASPLLN